MTRILVLLLCLLSGGAAAEPLTVRAGSHPGHGRIVIEGDDAAKTRAAVADKTLTIEAAAALDIEPAALRNRLPDYVAEARRSPDGIRLSIALKDEMRLATKATGRLFIIDLSPGWAASAEPKLELKAEAKAPAKDAKPGRSVIKGALLATKTHDGVVLRVETPAGLAAFHRGPALWLAFGAPVVADLPALEKIAKGYFGTVQSVSAQGGTALRLGEADTTHPRIARDGDAWVITLQKTRAPPRQAIALEAKEASLLVRTPADALQATDPEMGDRLLIAPARQAGFGHAGERALPGAVVLPSAQGLALVALSDDVALQPSGDGLEIVRATGGASQPQMRAGAGPVFDFAAWRRPELGSVLEGTRALNLAVSRAKPSDRLGARLDLARYRFAHGFGTEALGLVALSVREQPRLADDPDIRALRGAARLLAGDLFGAREDLALPGFDGVPEMALWRALLAAKMGDPGAAIDSFGQGLSILASYPDVYRARFAIAGAQAALDRSMAEIADQILASLQGVALAGSDRRAAAVLRGRLMAASGREEEAAKIWDAARRVGDPKVFVMSALFDTETGLRSGRLDSAKAITLLEQARYAWRGDELELKVLRALAPLYVQAGRERRALDAMRVAMTQFSAHPGAAGLAKDMAEIFATAFLSEEAERRPVLQTLALYKEFAELTPTGPKGEEVVARLSDRLAKLDLLDQAANLVERQLAAARDAEARLRIGTRLAELRFADARFADALSALEQTNVKDKDMPPELVKARGDLRARTLARLDRLDEAMAIAGDNADMRLDLAWQARKWNHAHSSCKPALTAIQAEGGKLADGDALKVLRCAVAGVLMGDEAAVAALQAKHAASMAAGPFKNAFAAVSAKPQAGELLSLAAQLGDVAAFKAVAAGRGVTPPPKT